MKRIPFFAALFSFTLLMSVRAAEAPSAQEQQILAVIKEVQAQQLTIAENEANRQVVGDVRVSVWAIAISIVIGVIVLGIVWAWLNR